MEFVLGVVILTLIVLVLIYNGLISRKNEVENSMSGIEVQLTKRYDLIPNLVSSVEKYMEHEKEVLNDLTELRVKALNASRGSNDEININNKISQGLARIVLSAENYPDLKASSNFVQLQRSLNEVEEQLAAARRGFNSAVTAYNNGLEMFPSNFIASVLGMQRKDLFQAPDFKKSDIKVKDLFS
tara:strand:- start:12921 stop:13475 length:555 start_codon:yes stop_codon:yes gene_type:complete